MKKQVPPAVTITLIVIAIVGVAAWLFRATTEVPVYPGLNAGHPAAEMQGGAKGGAMPSTPINNDQAKTMRIPGMNPAGTPGQPQSQTGQTQTGQ